MNKHPDRDNMINLEMYMQKC